MQEMSPDQTLKPTVFVVDDEEIIASSLAKILSLGGFSARSFTNPVKALSETTASEPAMLISDVFMPQMLGTDLAMKVKERNQTCRILLFSGNAATNDLLKQAREQGHDFTLLAKPVHPADLLVQLRQSSRQHFSATPH